MQQIPLTGKRGLGKFAIIDNEDFDKVAPYKWHINKDGYPMMHNKWRGKAIFMHRLIATTPKGKVTDHINGNKLDNRRQNLRICTDQENARNRSLTRRNTSGYKGVYWSKERRKWRCRISVNKKYKHVGDFKEIREAIVAYNKAAIKYHGKFAYLNPIH